MKTHTASLAPVADPPPPSELVQQVKRAHRSFPSGVTVVTAQAAGQPVGLVVNAFSSVSMDPLLVLVCINSSTQSHASLCAARHLGISILSNAQSAVAATFAKSGGDKFQSIPWHAGEQGAPLLDGASATFEVEVVSRVEAGTHSVFFGRIVGVETSDVPPLVYSAGGFFDGGRLLAI
ncbi:flavin reductase family protein [Streptomyces sp. NPDC042319]|uniref:flavin reductase family protein n=1 Tax=Streptomyces sp. NPDC042319 TaxID=3154332 RepID=UPI0033FCFE6B